MDRYIDLHTHTTASDGSMSPAELVRHAGNSGLAAVAITDHDTVDGLEEALNEADKSRMEVIPGVEIGVEYRQEMHILGYFLNGAYEGIAQTLKILKDNRNERNPKIVARLKEIGFNISLEDVLEEAAGGTVGRPHIANVLMKKGYVASIEEAFDRYLSQGKPAYFEKDKISPEDGIRKIIEAGGIPVLAHPIFLRHTNKELDDLLASLKAFGLKGIEAYYTDNTDSDTGNLLRRALKHNLLVTGGSDFHGSFKPDIEIGKGFGNLRVPYGLLDRLKARAQE